MEGAEFQDRLVNLDLLAINFFSEHVDSEPTGKENFAAFGYGVCHSFTKSVPGDLQELTNLIGKELPVPSANYFWECYFARLLPWWPRRSSKGFGERESISFRQATKTAVSYCLKQFKASCAMSVDTCH